MDKYAATEQAYKNGYNDGYQKAQSEVANKIIEQLREWYFYENPKTIGEVLYELEKKYKGENI
jgi:flagellar biosynthesis/type III secretory pathway protein FliH